MTADFGILILGVGNTLLQDEGVGVRVAEALAEAAETDAVDLPPGTRIVDGGTLGLDLLQLVEDARGVIFVDAVELGLAPGSTAVLRDRAVRGGTRRVDSAHDLGVAALIETARFAGRLPRWVSIVGIQPARAAAGLDLTPGVEAAVPMAADLARREAWTIALASTPS